MRKKRINKSKSITGVTRSLADKPNGRKNIATEKQFQKQQKLLLALEEVSKILTVEVDLHKILEDMAIIVGKAVGAKWVNFWELTPDKKSAYITASYGMKPLYMKQSRRHPVGLGTAWIGRAIQTGKTWGTNDVLSDPKLIKELGLDWEAVIKKQDFRALVCVPTISIKGPVGGMCVYYPEAHDHTDFEMRLITVAANQAATAITNAQIFNDLTAERNKTLSIIQSLQDGLIMYDLKGEIVFFNPKAEEFLLLNAEDIVGKYVNEDFKEKNVYWKNLFHISHLAQTEFTKKEYMTEGPQQLVLEIIYIPVHSNYQKIGAMQVLRNITKEKETDLLKSKFISTASHQLRTPLSSIKWALDALKNEDLGPINAEQKDLIEKSFAVNERLINLVTDLLDTSRIEEGRLGYTFAPGKIDEVVKKLFEELKTDAQRNKINFEFKKPAKPLPLINFDASKIEIAIRNVIDNAIKYTLPGGLIKIEFELKENSLLLIIKDTGIGIPIENQDFIFTKFFRAPNAIRLKPDGSGLGLYITSKIAEKHNAIINLESAKNKGSTFTFQFPLDPKKTPEKIIE